MKIKSVKDAIPHDIKEMLRDLILLATDLFTDANGQYGRPYVAYNMAKLMFDKSKHSAKDMSDVQFVIDFCMSHKAEIFGTGADTLHDIPAIAVNVKI